ncbi:branched-chain amino acid transport system permease protein [Rhizobium aquaticum]|uniref:Branched-chain amino acid transport system permease protein n=1 Tax=Rhizobium aquaticum TaxID=1549636 RepID=A0ABV2J679_9HYPH
MEATFLSAGQALAHAHAHFRSVRRRLDRISLSGVAVVAAALAILPPLFGDSYTIARLSNAVFYLIVALGFNIAFGLAGELALGYAAIMAVSAYTSGMLNVYLGTPGIVNLAASLGVGTGFGVLLMLPSLRVRGWYFGLVSMFAVLAMPYLIVMAEDWTGGENGLVGITGLNLLGVNFSFNMIYVLAVVVFAGLWLVVDNLRRSTWGLMLTACRDSFYAAQACGINPTRIRMVVFVLASVPASLAGFLMVNAEMFANPGNYDMNLTLLILTGVVLGGAGTLWGPVLGVGLLAGFSFWVGPFSSYNAVALGLMLMIGVVAFPNGVARSTGKSIRNWMSGRMTDVRPSSITPLRRHASSGNANAPVVDIKRLTIAFGAHTVVKGANLQLQRGTFCGLVGPNGSGKSTILNAICGAVQAKSGSIAIDGRNVTGLPMYAVGGMGVGRTFQMPQLIGDASVLENIMIGGVGQTRKGLLGALLRLPSERRRYREIEQSALHAFQRVGLAPELVGADADDLPLGLKRIVEVARAIAADPHLILLDEPAAGLNRAEKLKLGETLRRLNSEGVSVVLVEHNVSFVQEYCNEIALLDDGLIAARWRDGEPQPTILRDYIDQYPTADHDEEV